MRAETQQTPEVFENKSPAPPSSTHSKGSEVGPPIVAQSLQTTSRTSTPTNEGQTTAREPQIQYTEDNIHLEFQGDLLSVYSQSSGTVSYDSFAPLHQDYLDKMKGDSTQILCKGPDTQVANEVNLLSLASGQPSVESFNRAKLEQALFADDCPGSSFEHFQQELRDQSISERLYARLMSGSVASEFLRIVSWAFYGNLVRFI